MFKLVLFEPEIPPNTGNIIRLCANTGNQLHLIKPLGFTMDDKRLRRAGLDYSEWAPVNIHDSWHSYQQAYPDSRVFAATTRARQHYHEVHYQPGDTLLFGPETRGLPQSILRALGASQLLRIPMQDHSRSLNLSNSVAIVLFEAWRQQDFHGAS